MHGSAALRPEPGCLAALWYERKVNPHRPAEAGRAAAEQPGVNKLLPVALSDQSGLLRIFCRIASMSHGSPLKHARQTTYPLVLQHEQATLWP